MTQLQRRRRIDQRRARLQNLLDLLTDDAVRFDSIGKPRIARERMDRAAEIRQELKEVSES
jgi:hypothetical protein